MPSARAVSNPEPPVELARDLLRDAFDRVAQAVVQVLDGLDEAQLLWQPDPGANSVAWLVWHLSRVEDDHVADVGRVEQVWTSQGWSERFGLPYAVRAVGYGQSAEEVAAFTVADPGLLGGYYAAVHAQTRSVLDAMAAQDYARIVDRRWTPAVTAAVRLVSVVNDTTQHVGQAAYVRGLLERRGVERQL
ncbi:MAG: mycothiol transferase [Dermatophilaceae bacterium]